MKQGRGVTLADENPNNGKEEKLLSGNGIGKIIYRPQLNGLVSIVKMIR